MNLVDFLPSSLVFAMHRRSYFSHGGPAIASNDDNVRRIVKTIRDQGNIIIPNYWDRNKALALGEKLEATAKEIRAGSFESSIRHHWLEGPSIVRLLESEKSAVEVNDFFLDPMIEAVARAYTCGNVQSWQRMYESRELKPALGQVDTWHLDEAFYYKFKAFLYLSDVSAETAPYMYLLGSHKADDWRSAKERQMLWHDIYGTKRSRGFRGNFFDDREISFLRKQYGYEQMICVGSAGTLILTDTNGIHKATPPFSGGRRMLGHYFELSRKAVWPQTRKNG